MIIAAYGIVNHSPLDISVGLRSLNVSHSVVANRKILHVDGLAAEQPAWPVLIGLEDVQRFRAPASRPIVLLVTGSRAALAETNISQFGWDSDVYPDQLLRAILNSVPREWPEQEWTLQATAMSLQDYVEIASKPSFLTPIQTAIYKINPYPMRKEVQSLCIGYLTGRVSKSKLNSVLRSSWKYEVLQPLMNSEQAENLKAAIAEFQATGNVEAAARQHNLEPFEITYCVRSAEIADKAAADLKNGVVPPRRGRKPKAAVGTA